LLLIITNRDDLTADFLITRLLETGQPYYRINSEDLAEAKYLFSAGDDEDVTRCYTIAGKKLDLGDIRSVWYRRMIWPSPSQTIFPEQRRFAAGEIRHLVEGLVLDPSILWVNPIDATALGERKVFQLRLAREVGFRIPPTLISNDPKMLRDFAARHDGGVICKPIYHGLVSEGSKRYSVYTNQIDPDELADDAQLQACPTLLQKRIPKGTDIRATFIGRDVFPVEIFSSDAAPLDWRRPGEDIQYRRIELPPAIEHSCRDLLSRLRLSYGAFDFVRTPEGEVFFLEVNPTGEWAWLERALGIPMRDAFLRLFFDD
jgi:hypothetical protein